MPNSIKVGTITTPNPTLWLDMNSLGTDNVLYLIQTASPGTDWVYVNQFCSLLTSLWLNNPNLPNIYGITAMSDSVKQQMAAELINLNSLQAQVTEASNSIANATSYDSAADFQAVLDTLPAGTRVWAGNDSHVVGFVITATGTQGRFTFYDSNVGQARTGLPLSNLAQLVEAMGYSAYVVGTPT